jgi:osmotically inducible protein OsmC
MALSAELGKASITPESIHTTANLTMEWLEAGCTVTAIHLDVDARIPGGDQARYEAPANTAKADALFRACSTPRLRWKPS